MPTYEIEFEQGGKTMVLDVEGDRPPTDEEAHGLVQQHLSQGQSPEPAPAPTTPELPQAQSQAPQTSVGPMAYGAVQGAADIASIPEFIGGLASLPSRTTGAALKSLFTGQPFQMPPITPPKAGPYIEKQARHLLNKVGIPDESLDPDTRTEQFIQRVVREVTGTAVGLPAVRALSATARAAPVAGELLMGAAQGAGAATAQQIAPGNAAAEIAGQLAPNVVGLTRALAKNLGTKLVPDPNMLRKQVTQSLAEATGDMDQAGANLQRTLDVQASTPGLQPTLAEATGSPGLISLQRSQRAADPALAGRLTQQRNENIDAVTNALDELFKGGDQDDVRRSLTQTQRRVEQRLTERSQAAQKRLAGVQETNEAYMKRTQARINERVTRAQGEIRDQTAKLVKGGDIDALNAQEGASMQARRLYEDARKTFRTESRRLYENVDPENAVTGPVAELYDQAEDIARRGMLSFDQRDLPASLRDFDRSIKARASQPARNVLQPVAAEASSQMRDSQLELQQFIRRHGGINLSAESDIGGEFEALIRNRETGTTGLFRQTGGLTPQQMAERAQEAGFTFEADKFELLDAIRESMKTGKTYSMHNSTAFGDAIDDLYLSADALPVDTSALREADVSLNDLQRLRSHILRDTRAQAGPDAANKRRLLHEFRNAVENRMENLAREQGRSDIYENLQRANQFYRRNITKFSTGAGERILRQTNGRYKVSNAQVIREFLRTPEDAAQFVDGIGNRQAALETLGTYLDAELYLKAVTPETGRLNTARAQKFLQDRNPMMRLFPELRERYNNLSKLEQTVQRTEGAAQRITQRDTRRIAESEELLDAQQRAAHTQASVELQQQRLAREPGQAILKDTLDNGGIAQIMGRSDSNQQLIRLADTMRDNPTAREGIARSMWQEFLRKEGQRTGRDPITDNPLINEKQMGNFLTRYSGTLHHIYGAEHVANLRKVARGLQISRAADRSPVQMGSPTAELLQGQSAFMQGLGKAAMPVSMPLGTMKLRLLRFAGRSAINFIKSKKEEALQAITNEILYDPDISKTFAMLQDTRTAKQAGIRLKAHLIMLGAENRFDDPEGNE